MDIREIRKLLDMIRENDLAEFEVEDQGFRLKIKRNPSVEHPAVPASPPAAAPAPLASAPPAAAPPTTPSPDGEEARWISITAPIVGTFYRSPAPDVEPFVTVGQEVDENTVVCIIEAMKVMNEIKADCRGIVRKVLVDNATAVQFGQPLFRVEPL